MIDDDCSECESGHDMFIPRKRVIYSWRHFDFFFPRFLLSLNRFERFLLIMVSWQIGKTSRAWSSWYMHELGKEKSCSVCMVWYYDYLSSLTRRHFKSTRICSNPEVPHFRGPCVNLFEYIQFSELFIFSCWLFLDSDSASLASNSAFLASFFM